MTNERGYDYDADRNMDTFTDELEHTWTMTYGPVGNLETITSPLPGDPAQTWTLDWEQPDDENRPNFWRLIEVTDPLEHWVQYGYDDEGFDPTLVVSITEMSADGIGDPAVTTIEYYDDDGNNSFGQVRLVTDANDVGHLHEYDTHGYFKQLTESGASAFIMGPPTFHPTVIGPGSSNPDGWPTGANDGDTGIGSSTTSDANGNPSAVICTIVARGEPEGVPTRLGSAPSNSREELQQCLASATYDIVGRPLAFERCFSHGQAAANTRTHTFAYDTLGRATDSDVETNEHDPLLSTLMRSHNFTLYDADGHLLEMAGPDGLTCTYTYDELGRPQTATRGSSSPGVAMGATFIWDDASRLERIEYDNGAKVLYQYDEANRVEQIIHKDALDAVLYQFDYTWNLDNTLASRVETDNVAMPATVTTVAFGYDNRKRLTDESRTIDDDPDVVVYDVTYDYDQLGNRTSKTDNTPAALTTTYVYDVDGEEEGEDQTHNNRLLSYSEFDPNYEGGEKPTRTVSYIYYANGRCSNIIIRDADDLDGKDRQIARGLTLYYASNGELWQVVWETWSDDGKGGYDDHVKTAAVEFRYDSLRGRYLRRAVDPNDSFVPIETGSWTDYTGDTPYGDFTLTPGGLRQL